MSSDLFLASANGRYLREARRAEVDVKRTLQTSKCFEPGHAFSRTKEWNSSSCNQSSTGNASSRPGRPRQHLAERVGLPLSTGGRNALAGHPGRLVGGEKQRNPRNIVRPAKPPHGEREAQRLCRLGAEARAYKAFGLGHAWRDRIDADSSVGQLDGELARDRSRSWTPNR